MNQKTMTRSMASKPLEKAIENQIKDELKDRGAWFVKIFAGGGMPAGVPDILCCYQGYFIGFENKRPGMGRITRVQKVNLDHITQNGGIGVVPQSLSFAKQVLDALDQDDFETLKELGYQSHGRAEINDDQWIEECIW